MHTRADFLNWTTSRWVVRVKSGWFSKHSFSIHKGIDEAEDTTLLDVTEVSWSHINQND